MSGTKVYVGNLSWGTTDDSLRTAFESFGEVTDSVVLKDRRSRGFGFVTFSSPDEANQAVSQMNEQALDGRNVRVNIARENPNPRGGGGFRGGYNRGGDF